MANARKILIVDDDTDLRDTLVEQLSLHEEFEASAVDTGAKGATAAKANSPDLVLMDVMMPVMDGVEALTAIRAEEAATGRPRTAIQMLTANVFDEDVARYMAAGADGVLRKPIEIAALQAVLSAAPQHADA